MEVVSGDKLTTSISGLHTDNRYYFKIYANTSKGAGPMSDAVAHHTGKRASNAIFQFTLNNFYLGENVNVTAKWMQTN